MSNNENKKKKKTFGDPTYKERESVSMTFNPIDVFKKSKDLKDGDSENE